MRQVLAPVTIHSQYMNSTRTLQSSQTEHCAINSLPEKQGDKSLFMNSNNYYSSNSAPTESFRLLLLSVEKKFTSNKTNSLSVIPAIS